MPFLTSYETILAREQGGERPSISNPIQHAPAPVPSTRIQDDTDTVDDDQATAYPSDSVPPAVPIGPTAHGALTNAHHFTIGHLTPIEHLEVSSNTYPEPIIKYLLERGKPAAIHDSSARAYPPLCHPDTRKTLRGRVVRWGMGDGDERMLWVLGSAAVGKSAVAQTVAEEFKRAGRLGASFFFSRPNHLDDPDWVIPTIVYQLATQNREYKRIITQCLVDDILILDKNRSTQFRELIIEPFRILMTQYPHTIREPLLIILDGLDECSDKEAQCEFIDLINTCSRQVPLRWMICSRPDWLLMTVLSNPDFMVTCRREELKIRDDEAQRDVQRLLEVEFDTIRQKYRDRLPVDWPPEYQQRQIASIASGHLGFASFILRFIGDRKCDDPDGQLKVCMMFLKGGHTPISPLRALGDLYCQVLSGVPVNILSTTMRILGLVVIDRHGLDSADDQARFLGLDQVTFRRALQNLHSVVYVPSIEESNTTPLHIYHASFSDFLNDVRRSGEFHLNREAAKYDFALQCLHWIENDNGSPDNIALVKFSKSRGWDACCNLSDEFVPGLVSRLERFDFSRLSFIGVGSGFASFLQWLHSLGRTRNKSVIRVGWSSFFTRSSDEIRLEHQPLSAHQYIASFIPDILAPELPFTLKLRLGTAVRAYITLRVVARDASHADHLHLLGKGCRAIQEKFSDHLPANWPKESNFLRLADSASGDINNAAFLLRFIGDDVLADPDAQLKTCMRILSSDRGGGGTIKSPRALNPLYHHIFSNIPTGLLPITTRILGFLVFGASSHASADSQARFLGLDPIIFRQSLQNLHSIIYVPPQDKFNTTPLYIYRQSCSYFLEANRPTGFRLDMEAAKYDIVLRCLRWIENDDEPPSNRDLINFSVSEGWKTCRNLSKDFIPSLISRLGCFEPHRLTRGHIEAPEFTEFIQWMYSVGSTCDRPVITIVPVLNPLYHHVVSEISTDLLPITMCILELLILYPKLSLSADDQARFLGFDQGTFRQVLQKLHSVVYVPPIEKSNTTPVHIYHTSFSDFLDSNRSDKFHSNRESAKHYIIRRCLHWIENDDGSPSHRDLINFSVSEGWKTCRSLSKDFIPSLISLLRRFGFRRLTRAHIEAPEFAEFIQWLYSVGSTCGKSVITVIPGAPQESAISNGLRLIYRMPSRLLLRDLFMLGKPDPATHTHIASLTPNLVASEILFAMKLQLGYVSQAHVTLVVIDDKTEGVLGSLRRGFDAIRGKFKPDYPGHWPSESHLLQLALLASDDVGIASFLLRFIGDELYCDPVGQLKVCMKFLDGGRIVASGAVDPSRTLELIYHSILCGIPPNHLPIAMRILRFLNLYHRGLRTADDQAKFLGLDQATFRGSIQNLHSVVHVPPVNECNTTSVRIYHHSFSDFLEDPNRSGKFYLDRGAVEYHFALQCLHWIENGAGSPSNKAIFGFTVSSGWGACCNLPDDFIPGLISRLERFDFCRLTYAHVQEALYFQKLIIYDGFAEFLRWLFSLGSIRNKSLISVISKQQASASEEMQVEHWTESPRDYIASFIPSAGAPQIPFTLRFRLGSATHVYVSLEVHERSLWPGNRMCKCCRTIR